MNPNKEEQAQQVKKEENVQHMNKKRKVQQVPKEPKAQRVKEEQTVKVLDWHTIQESEPAVCDIIWLNDPEKVSSQDMLLVTNCRDSMRGIALDSKRVLLKAGSVTQAIFEFLVKFDRFTYADCRLFAPTGKPQTKIVAEGDEPLIYAAILSYIDFNEAFQSVEHTTSPCRLVSMYTDSM
jgi:hypothetical protein